MKEKKLITPPSNVNEALKERDDYGAQMITPYEEKIWKKVPNKGSKDKELTKK